MLGGKLLEEGPVPREIRLGTVPVVGEKFLALLDLLFRLDPENDAEPDMKRGNMSLSGMRHVYGN